MRLRCFRWFFALCFPIGLNADQNSADVKNYVMATNHGIINQAGHDILVTENLVAQRPAGPTTLKFASITPAAGCSWEEDYDIRKNFDHRVSEFRKWFTDAPGAGGDLDDPDQETIAMLTKAWLEPLYENSAHCWVPKNDPDATVDRLSEPAFDVSLRNTSSEVVVITAVGFEVVKAGILHPTFGEGFEPFTVKISFSYTLPFPKFLRRYKTKDDWQGFIWDKRASPVASMVRFDDPVGLPPNGVVRYLLKIKDFYWAKSADNEMPANHALVRLVVNMGDAGVLRSDNIYLNSIQ